MHYSLLAFICISNCLCLVIGSTSLLQPPTAMPPIPDSCIDKSHYDEYGYDSHGFDCHGFDIRGYDKFGYDDHGYDRAGYNKQGYDREGHDRAGYKVNGYDRFGFDKHGRSADGYNTFGYGPSNRDKEGYDVYGYNCNCRAKNGRRCHRCNDGERDCYGFDKFGRNSKGKNHAGDNSFGYDDDGYDSLGFNIAGLDHNGYDKNGFNRRGYDINGFDRQSYNREGYDADGYSRRGCNRKNMDKQNKTCDPCIIASDGFDCFGFDSSGYDKQGYDEKGYDREGYDVNGNDRRGYDREGFDRAGYDRRGYDRAGYDRQGYDNEGYDRAGYDKHGYDREGYDIEGYDQCGYDRKGEDKHGCNRKRKCHHKPPHNITCPTNCTECTVSNMTYICTACVSGNYLVRGSCYYPRTAIIAVYYPTQINTCFGGIPCGTNTDCIGLRNDANDLLVQYTQDSMQTYMPGDPILATLPLVVCLNMTLNSTEVTTLMEQFIIMQQNVANWTFGTLQIQYKFYDIGTIDIIESRWGIGVWVGPWNVQDILYNVLARDTIGYPDFNMFIAPIRDPVKQLHHDLGGCGGTFGTDYGVAGAGWTWVPVTSSSFWFECAEQSVLIHEWMHQVHWDIHTVSPGYTDIYNYNLPPCGQYVNDTYQWYPDSHQCNEDPDYDRCGLGNCGTNDDVNSHILSAHWDPARPVVFNTCTNNVFDAFLGETSVDVGGQCLLTPL